ncbi:MAG: DNA repair protein RecN [Flavobacteriales bacterium]
MLSRLFISNYALIDEVKMDFAGGLSIITGETGSGKSILLDALGLLMGNRADSSVITNKEKKTIVEGVFAIDAYGLIDFFKENDLDYEKQSILRREINPAGKSRAFINDTPVTLQQLKELTERLIDIHAQHQNTLLNSQDFFFQLLSSEGKFSETEKKFQIIYSEWQQQKKALKALKDTYQQMLTEQDYIRFQVEELVSVNVQPDEELQLEENFKALSHAEEISRQLYHFIDMLQEGDFAVLSRLKESSQILQSIVRYTTQVEVLLERLQATIIELRDITDEASAMTDQFQPDPEALRKVSNRLDLLQSLMQKHRVSSSSELLDVKQNFESRISASDHLEEQIRLVEKETTELEQQLNDLADALFKLREQSIPIVCSSIESVLKKLQMPDARFQIQHEVIAQLHRFGKDQLQPLFSANKGIKPERLDKVASGGEISRLMLAIKKLLAGKRALPTMIFDEIDTGVSGAIADAMGDILREMGSECQVFAITHLPQVAAKGQTHFKVLKEKKDQSVFTRIVRLSEEERINEIASMLSGKELTEAALINARTLLSAD